MQALELSVDQLGGDAQGIALWKPADLVVRETGLHDAGESQGEDQAGSRDHPPGMQAG